MQREAQAKIESHQIHQNTGPQQRFTGGVSLLPFEWKSTLSLTLQIREFLLRESETALFEAKNSFVFGDQAGKISQDKDC